MYQGWKGNPLNRDQLTRAGKNVGFLGF